MKKGRLINFEWMCDHNHYTDKEFDVIKTSLIKKDIDQASKDGCNTVIGLYLLDGFLQPNARHAEFITHLNELKSYAENLGIKIYLVSGHGEHIDNCPFDYFYFDLNVRLTSNSYSNLTQLPHYNPKNDKFLFLTGMPDRPNRIGLMSRFYDSNLLQNAEWTFFPPWTKADKEWCRSYITHYDDDEYNDFLNYCEKSFDGRFETAKPFYGSYTSESTDIVWHDVVEVEWVRAPAHIDSEIYKNTLFSIISEGPNFWDDNNFFVTEKSWRTFLHKHPFIFAGHPDQFRYLKQLGYKTFEEYLPISDYAFIENEEHRLDAVVENTRYLLSHREHDEDIFKDTEYNYTVFLKQVDSQNKFIQKLKTMFNIPQEELDYYFQSTGYTNLIRRIPNE